MMSKYIDFHNHSQNAYDSEVVALPTYRLGVDSIPPYMPHIWVGIHPYDSDKHIEFTEYFQQVASRVVGIGEIGFDYYYNSDNIEQQNLVFTSQLEMAIKHNYPVTIHCVRGYNNLLQILKSFKCELPAIVLHSFIGSIQLMNDFAKQGCYFSFSACSFASRKTVEAMREVSLDRVFLESDDSAVDIKELYELFSQLREDSSEQIKNRLYNNFKKVVDRWQVG